MQAALDFIQFYCYGFLDLPLERQVKIGIAVISAIGLFRYISWQVQRRIFVKSINPDTAKGAATVALADGFLDLSFETLWRQLDRSALDWGKLDRASDLHQQMIPMFIEDRVIFNKTFAKFMDAVKMNNASLMLRSLDPILETRGKNKAIATYIKAYLLHISDLDQSIALMKALTETKKKIPEYHMFLGSLYDLNEDPEKARWSFERANELLEYMEMNDKNDDLMLSLRFYRARQYWATSLFSLGFQKEAFDIMEDVSEGLDWLVETFDNPESLHQQLMYFHYDLASMWLEAEPELAQEHILCALQSGMQRIETYPDYQDAHYGLMRLGRFAYDCFQATSANDEASKALEIALESNHALQNLSRSLTFLKEIERELVEKQGTLHGDNLWDAVA